MNRRIGWVLVVFGVTLAIGTGALVFLLLRQQETRAQEQARIEAQAAAPRVATMELPVAARPIAPGAVLTPEDLLVKEFPLDLVPVSAITQTISLENQVVIAPIGQGETFSPRQIAGQAAATVSQKAPAGKVIFAYPIADLLTSADIIHDGDRIDLLITMPIPSPEVATSTDGSVAVSAEGETATFFTLQNVEVFQVLRGEGGQPAEGAEGEAAPAGPPSALLLALSPEDAVIIKHAKDSGGVIDFVLRSVLDDQPFDAPTIDRADLIERYVNR